MKKLLFVVLLFISTIASAQHLTFQGIEINGSKKEFVEKLKVNSKVNKILGSYFIQYDGNEYRNIKMEINKDNKNLYCITINYDTNDIQPKYTLIEKLKKIYNVVRVTGNLDNDYVLVTNTGTIEISRLIPIQGISIYKYTFYIFYVDNLNSPKEEVKSNNI